MEDFFDLPDTLPTPFLLISGKSSPIHLLALGPGNVTFTAADDQRAVWQMNCQDDPYISLELTAVLSTGEDCVDACFDRSGTCLAVCMGREILVFNLESPLSAPWVLSGHSEVVNSSAFVPNRQMLVSTSEDGTAKVWEYPAQRLLYSVVLTNGPASAVCVDPEGVHVAFTSPSALQVHSLEVATSVRLQNRGNVLQNGRLTSYRGTDSERRIQEQDEEPGESSILRACFLDFNTPILVVATQACLFAVDPVSQKSQMITSAISGVATFIAMDIVHESLLCYRSAAFNNTLTVFSYGIPEVNPAQTLSVFPSSEPEADSPLLKNPFSVEARTNACQSRGKARKVSKVRSSGYGNAPVLRMFSGTSGKAKKPRKQKRSLDKKPGKPPIVKEYPSSCGVLEIQQDLGEISKAHKGGILSMCYSNDGTLLLSGSSDKTARLVRGSLKQSGRKGVDFEHSSAVLGVELSHTKLHYTTPTSCRPDFAVLTTTTSGKAALWSASSPYKFFSIPAENVQQAEFYYLDKFILTSTPKSVSLNAYQLAASRFETLKPSRVSTVKQWSFESRITGMVAMNCFLSHILLVSTGSSINCINAGTNQVFPITHQRDDGKPIHSLALPVSSIHTASSPSEFNTFLSASTENGGEIELWDLRTARPVHRFIGHCNRALRLCPRFSPCLRYVATGSEDNAAYIFDMRTAGIVASLRHKETVSSVAFHPLLPQLLCGDLGGHISLFTEENE